MWELKGWDSFWEPPDTKNDERIEKVLLTTFGLDPDFLLDELLTRLFGLTEPGSIDWLYDMCDELKNNRVIVFADAREYATSPKNLNSRFSKYGGTVLKVKSCQHSKIWLIQSTSKTTKKIRIAISSCNLTRDAFQNQIQYVWVEELNLTSKDMDSNSDYLANFVMKLTNSLVDSSIKTYKENIHIFEDWNKWINKAKFPNDVKLIATVPNLSEKETLFNKKKLQSFGLDAFAQLKDWLKLRTSSKNYHLYMQVFSVGKIEKSWIDGFCESLHVDNLHLLWPVKDKLFPFWQKMIASKSSLNCLITSSNKYYIHPLEFDKSIKFPERLPHGKLYALWDSKLEKYKAVILGSSNLSFSAWEQNFEMNIVIKFSDDIYYCLDDLLKIDEDIEPDIETLHFSTEQDEPINNSPWFILEAVREESKNKQANVLITFDTSCPVSSVTYALLDQNDNELQRTKKSHIIDSTNSAHSVVVYFKISNDVYDSRKATIRKSFKEEISSMPEYQLNYEHWWILRKFGWPKEIRERAYQTNWMALSKAVFSVIDRWDEVSINKEDDAIKLEKAFNWMEEICKLDPDASFSWLVWEIGAQELSERKKMINSTQGL